MEELKTIIIERWPEIVSYALNFIAYFLFLVYRTRFIKTRNNMRVLFDDKVTQVNTIDKNLRTDIETERVAMREDLLNAIEEHKRSKAEYDKCIAELNRMGKALAEIIAEQEVDDNGTDNE